MYSQHEVRRARQIDLVSLLPSLGFELKAEGNGNFRVKGYAGLIVKGHRWYQHSSESGGNALDFLVDVMGMSFSQATDVLLGSHASLACVRAATHDMSLKDTFTLPSRSTDASGVIRYLTVERCLPLNSVIRLILTGLLYQDDRHNAVFVCKDSANVPKAAVLRGTGGRAFKGMAKGSDSSYGWRWRPNDPACAFRCVAVTESPIDAVSLYALRKGFGSREILSLNGVRVEPLRRYIDSEPDVEVILVCLDNDEAGNRATEKIQCEFSAGRSVYRLLPHGDSKDWNECLIKQGAR